MRPLAGSEAFPPRSRKPSLAEPSLPQADAHSTSPVTFFLRRGSHGNEANSSADIVRGQDASPAQCPADTFDVPPRSTSPIVVKHDTNEESRSPRRRSTLIAKGSIISPRSPSANHTESSRQEPLTPLLIPSDPNSLPSSPKSTSTRSLRPSEADSAAEDSGSQAVLSSGDEEPEPDTSLKMGEAAPQLIMPSIKMPSRRPFTERGKQITNFKILIAGSRGLSSISSNCFVAADHSRRWQKLSYKVDCPKVRRYSSR
jgi:hypothetical protein